MDATFVYVLETGADDGRYIKGVYATAEAAMAAHQPEPPKTMQGVHWYEWMGPDIDARYDFDGDGGDAAEIQRYEVRS